MHEEEEVVALLRKHLQSIYDNDVEAYHATTGEDLTLYEWWVTPHRLDGLPFHDFMMQENARRNRVFGSRFDVLDAGDQAHSRYDLSNLKVQRYGDAAIASYTLLVSSATDVGVKVAAHNESRVMVKESGEWKVVHVHKSPAWPAPHTQPESS